MACFYFHHEDAEDYGQVDCLHLSYASIHQFDVIPGR